MNIDAQWIPLADELPQHDTHCIVGNVNERDPNNPLLDGKWKAAVFVNRDKLLEIAESVTKLRLKLPIKGPRFYFECRDVIDGVSCLRCKDATEFTHWWPIPKPFTEHPV